MKMMIGLIFLVPIKDYTLQLWMFQLLKNKTAVLKKCFQFHKYISLLILSRSPQVLISK